MALSSNEQRDIRNAVDSGSYDIDTALNSIAYANLGSKLRYALYAAVYWLKKHYTDSTEGVEAKQPLLTAGDNVTITGSGYNQVLSATDTKNTTGTANQSTLPTRSYLVLSDDTTSDYAVTYSNSAVYLDSSGNLYAGGGKIRHDYSAQTATSSSLSSGTTITVTDIVAGNHAINLALTNGSAGTTGSVTGVLSVQYSTNGTTWYGVGNASYNISNSTSDGAIIATFHQATVDGTQYRGKITITSGTLPTGSTLTLTVY